MKKIVTALLALTIVSTPVMAREPDNGDYRGSSEHHHHRGGKWVGPLLGGIFLGALLSSRSDREEYREDRNQYIPPDYRYDRRYCVDEQVVEWHYGRRYVFWQTRCN